MERSKPHRLKRRTGPRSYEAYADQLRADIDCIRLDWARASQNLVLLFFAAITAFVAFIVTIMIANGQAFIPNWVGHLLFFSVLLGLGIILGPNWRRTAAAIVQLCFNETSFRCPHCAKQIDLTQVWQCGWCGILSNENMLQSPSLIFDGCAHKGRHIPSAIKCCHCDADIVRDEYAYLRECRTNSRDMKGIAEFLPSREEQRRRARLRPVTREF